MGKGLGWLVNNTTVIGGGIIIIVLIGALLFFTNDNVRNMFTNSNATSTPSGIEENGAPIVEGQSRTPGLPVATTNATVAPTDTTAVVTGTVIPRGAKTTYWYEYGTSASFGQRTAEQEVGSGWTAIPTPGYITGLTRDTTYYFRLVAKNQFGQVTGSQGTVKTLANTPAPVVGGLPTSKTLSATSITRTTANIGGEVNPNKAATQYWFEYGTNANLGNVTSFISAGDGANAQAVTASLSGLTPGTTYSYRMNAQNQFGTVNGAVLTFETAAPAASSVSAPTATTRDATSISSSNASLRGTVDPNGGETTYWFEYSTDSLLGNVLLKTTPRSSAGAGTNGVPVQAEVTGLSSKTSYYVRLVAENSKGTVRGEKVTFKTK